MKKISRVGITTLLVGMGILGTRNLITNVIEATTWVSSRRAVQMEIDIDSNKIFTKKEWIPVYQYLGVEPSEDYGLDLSTEQLRQYLNR